MHLFPPHLYTPSCTQVQCYPPHPFPPHLYTLSCTQVQCHTVMHTSAVLPATPVSPIPVHTVTHTSAMLHCHAHKCNVTRPCTQVQCHTVMHTSVMSHRHAHKRSVTRHTRFPPHLYTTAMHTSAMLPAILAAAFRLRGFQQWSLSCHEEYYS